MRGSLAIKAKTIAILLFIIIIFVSLAPALATSSSSTSDSIMKYNEAIEKNIGENYQNNLPPLVANYDPASKSIYDFFSGVGAFLGLSSDSFVNATIGMLTLLMTFTIILALTSVGLRRRRTKSAKKNQTNIVNSEPNKQPQVNTSPVPPLTPTENQPTDKKPDAQLTDKVKQSTDSPTLPSALNLQAHWTEGKVTLTWEPPQINAKGYRLDGYVISAVQYGPMSISPAKAPIAHLPLNETQWSEAFTQTYRWNSRGDIDGYIVEAIVRYNSKSGFKGILRIGAITYAP
jgi:hypothetical protein